jgi:CIC family chloride channel protein
MRRISPETQAAMVGGVVGLLAFFAPQTIGSGESQVQAMLDGGHALATIAILFAVRLVLGPLCYAPGLPGGLFAPLLAIGAAAGLLMGMVAETLIPGLSNPLAAFAAVGMGALFVAVVGAPVTGIALVVEMTGATSLFVPLLATCASALAVPALLGVRPIYDILRDRDKARRERPLP